MRVHLSLCVEVAWVRRLEEYVMVEEQGELAAVRQCSGLAAVMWRLSELAAECAHLTLHVQASWEMCYLVE